LSDVGPSSPGGGRLGAIFLTVFLDLLGFGLVIPLLPRYAQSLSATPFQIGLIAASYSAMQFLFVPVWGALSDRVGRRPILLVSIFATAGSMLILGFATSLPMLVIARVFGGIATANIAVAQAYIADTTTHAGRARGMGLIGTAFGLGFVLGPFVGGVLSAVSLETPARVAAGLAVINFVWAFFLLPESLPVERRDNARRLRVGLDFLSLRRVLGYPGVAIGIGLFFVATVSFANLEQTFALYAHDEFKLDARATGYILGMVGVIAMIVQGGLIGRLNHRFGEVRLIRIGNLLQAAGFFGIGYAAGHRLLVLYAAVAVMSVGNGLVNPSLSTYVSRRAPPNAQGESLGVMQSMGSLARVAGPTFGGFLYGYGHRLPYFSGAIGLCVAFGLALWLRD
jgi:DHA1 family tetracycline resistance protein-like MFS transporter